MKSNVEWQKWGESDPFYGVAAWEGHQRDGASAWEPERFYALGRSDWADFVPRWEQYGLKPEKVVEIGCGAGRLTRPMADHFDRVIALDVAPGMLSVAAKYAAAPNIEYRLVESSTIPVADHSVSGVFSTHVFQHFDAQAEAMNYFREIARVLQPGGSLMIHLPITIWPSGSGAWVRWPERARQWKSDTVARIKRWAISRGLDAELMKMTTYEAESLFEMLDSAELGGVELSIIRTRSNGALHPFVLARQAHDG
ncbi:MAG: class I SAM-dependent methyltransferase [Xanthomonadales bacterium]|nr:class I SAM-dependent methyltransferase [Xanthomonadales bacterium]